MYAEAHPGRAKAVAAASVAHLTAEYALLKTDPVIKWAQTRWPTFVEVRVARYPLPLHIKITRYALHVINAMDMHVILLCMLVLAS
jgi:hypothetical protein